MFEDKLLEMEEAKVDVPSSESLYITYMKKLNQDTRTRVMARDWKLDGDASIPREPRTWQEVAKSVNMANALRTDVWTMGRTQEQLLALAEPGTKGRRRRKRRTDERRKRTRAAVRICK